jgi:tetratricopeptide (TPR) repeat protein
LAKLVGAIALRDFAKADELLPPLREKLHPADFWRLWGDRYWFEGKHERAAESYRSARLARDAAPIRLDLACALVRAGKPSAEDAHREASDLLADGLKHIGDDRATALRMHSVLGSVWLHHPSGERDANVRRAIEHLEEALGLTDPSGEPDWWAHTHMDLGAAWLALPTGKKVENVQRAVTCFDRACAVWTREREPERWALAQNWLAQSWERLPAGDRSANLRRAIEHISAALEVRTRDAHPAAWATLQNNLGNIYVQLPEGDHGAHIRAAIECEEAALEVWSRLESRSDWAATQNNLGNAWALLPSQGEERERNLRRAIAAYKSALEVRTRSGSPAEWASTLNNMGSALMHLPGSSRGSGMIAGVDALHEAIMCFEKALEVRTREAFPLDWAKTQTNLGQAWTRRPAPGRMEHLKQAIECYNRALTVFRADTHPHQHRHVSDLRGGAQDLLDELQILG